MFDFTETKNAFQEVKDQLKKEYLQISTGRANPSLLDAIKIDSYGTQQPLKNVASITTDDARTLRITPWDKSQIKDIEKAVVDSKLPFSVSSNESSVMVNIPQLTEEGKKEIMKLVKEKLEIARVRVRNIRQDSMKEIERREKEGEYAEDDKNRFKEELQKLVDATNKDLEEIYSTKEKDIMSV